MALRQPHPIALQQIEQLGKASHSVLEKLAFTEKYPMKTRWKAFMLLSISMGEQSIPMVKKALQSKTWFMRSAGLVALQSLDPQGAKKWAYRILNNDPALMVRMKAVEVLQQNPSEEVTELFWKKVYSADSLHRDKSLWIRSDLAQVLVKDPRKKDLQRWVRLLHDEDKKLQVIASLALEKLHNNGPDSAHPVSFWQERFPAGQKSL